MRPLVIRTRQDPPYIHVELWHRASQKAVGRVSIDPRHYPLWFLTWVGVDEGFRNQGWATKLLERVERLARSTWGVTHLELDECLDNPKSTLYTRLGYRRIGIANKMRKPL